MKNFVRKGLGGIGGFFRAVHHRRLAYLFMLILVAILELVVPGIERQSFEFYTLDSGKIWVEERMFRRVSSMELTVTRYVEEALLGPAGPKLAPLFSQDTRLRSLLFRDGTVYVDLSEAAALPPPEGELFRSLDTLNRGIRRNFSFVKEVRLFIEGNEVIPGKNSRNIGGRG